MPVRSRKSLLAGMGAMVGFCFAGVGCQSSGPRLDAYAVQTEQAAPSRPLLSGAVVSLLRPVPVNNSGPGNGAVASDWRPVQRASSTELPTVAGHPAVGETVQVAGPGTMPTAVENPIAIDIAAPVQPDRPNTDRPNSDKPAGRDHEEATPLHPPTLIGPTAGVIPLPPPAVDGPPREFCKKSLPPYVVEPPDILLIQSSQKLLIDQPLIGQHLVRPDGYVSLGIYGEVYVAGYTLDQVRAAVTMQIRKRVPEFNKDPTLASLDVDVIAYNSKVYYIVTDGGGYGEQVYRIPCTGNETVLDAMSQINGLPAVASKKKIWLARATPGEGAHPIVLPVDWRRVTMVGSGATNYQVFPGDRLYVGADPFILTDSWLAKRLAPVERLLGITLLGSSTVNSIRTGNNTGLIGQ